MSTPLPDVQALASALRAWFRANARDLPWRTHYSPYAVWISEVMLQQTQMQRGVEYFLRWMERFPTLEDVAAAQEEEILHAWEGLGYYSRARNLWACAKKIVRDYQGHFPTTRDTLLKLPGIGPYTAAAIASIAFSERVACVDANVERVISRLFDIEDDVKSVAGKRQIEEHALALIPADGARETNQALMEFGALVCVKRPACPRCPLAKFCLAAARHVVLERPVKQRAVRANSKVVAAALVCVKDRLLLEQRPHRGLWAHLWTLPSCDVPSGAQPVEALITHLARVCTLALKATGWSKSLVHSYTTWTIDLSAWELILEAPTSELALPEAFSWLPFDRLGTIALPSPHRTLLSSYLAERAQI